jgi:hypothetical protein
MSGPTPQLLIGILGAGGLIAAAWIWLRATLALRHGGKIERFLDAFLFLSWLGVVAFTLLASLSLYNRWAAGALLIACGLVAQSVARHRLPAAGSESLDEPQSLGWPAFRNRALWAAIPVLVVALLRLVKSMVQPPMAWDAMTYHLPKAAFWIQSGSFALPNFPDAWSHYRWFPAGGDILFSWVMLPLRSDFLLGPFGFLVWSSIVAASARLALYLGANRTTAWLTGFALAAMPAALAFMTASYVDTLLVLFVLLAISHAAMFLKSNRWSNAVTSVAATGLALAVKISSILLAVPLLLAVLVPWIWRRRSGKGLVALIVTFSAPCLGYLYTWINTGSPFFPFKVPVFTSLPFHQRLDDSLSGRLLLPDFVTEAGWQGFVHLFWSTPQHMNFGIGGLILFGVATFGLIQAIRRPDRRGLVLLCLTGAVVSTPAVLNADNLALRTIWIGVMARGLLPLYAPILVWAATTSKRLAIPGLILSVAGSAVHFRPLGWSPAMTRPALVLTAILILCAGAGLVLQQVPARALRPRLRLGLIALVSFLFLQSWTTIRARARYPIYRETASNLGAFDVHTPHQAFAMAASLWSMLDSPEEKRIAVAVGRDRVGHNQFFYPLFGSSLQNQLVHVPISPIDDGTDSEPESRYSAADPEAWVSRLDRESVDLVVGLWPPTPERDWLAGEASFEVAALTDLESRAT